MNSTADTEADDAVPGSTGSGRGRAFRVTAFVVLLALSLIAAVLAWDLGTWSHRRPGPGFWPLLVGAVMFLCITGTWLRERKCEVEAPPETSWRREFVAFGSIIAYIISFAYLGLMFPTFFLIMLWLKTLANEPWRLVLPLSIAGTATIYAVFDALLGVPFPSGVLGVAGM